MSPDTLRKLREWLTLEEAASELATALSEDVCASDVLRLVLDGHLELSIQLPAKTTARCRKLDDDAPNAPRTHGTINGVWDVPMVGRGRSQIENDYQWQRAGLYVPKDAPVGALVEQDDLVCQVPPDRGESGLSPRPESEFPQGSVLGVRRPALEAFIRANQRSRATRAHTVRSPGRSCRRNGRAGSVPPRLSLRLAVPRLSCVYATTITLCDQHRPLRE